MNITVVGGGSWGTALAILLHGNGHRVTVWCYSEADAEYLRSHRESRHLKGAKIPEEIEVTADISVVSGAELVVSAVPSFAVRETAEKLRDHLRPGTILVSVTKGIERGTAKRMSQILSEVTGHTTAALSGPTHAEEVSRHIPTGCGVACADGAIAEQVQDVFMNPAFRVYAGTDVVGVELGAALKNIYALIAGVLDGAGCGDNTKALMMTRGLTEAARLGVALGAERETFAGLSGVGDLIVTCCSMHSRNYRCGILIGQGMDPQSAMREVGAVVEGYYAAASAHELAQKTGVEMPIAEAAYQSLYGSMTPAEAIEALMGRAKKREAETNWLLG